MTDRASSNGTSAQSPTVVVMPGDGIGPLVVSEALRVLEAVAPQTTFIETEIGWDAWRRSGTPLPDRTVALLEEHGLGFFGAITSKPEAEANAALHPSLRGRGLRYESPILALRRKLQLTTSVRPCHSWPGNPTSFLRRGADGVQAPAIDITVVMQNTEGLYAGIGWTSLPDALRAALDAHPNMAPFQDDPSNELALSCRLVSMRACRHIAHAAFHYAQAHGKSNVTLCDKWGVMQQTASLLSSAARQEALAWPSIELRHENVDALLAALVRTPERYGVILCGALVGDLVSDAASGLVGGLGFAPCANLGETCAVFEPTHGSAPDIAHANPPLANPIAAILASAMLCEHMGDTQAAQRIRSAVKDIVREGDVQTADMLPVGSTRAPAPTKAMTDAIVEKLGP